jgi:hypothetical protein
LDVAGGLRRKGCHDCCFINEVTIGRWEREEGEREEEDIIVYSRLLYMWSETIRVM